MELMRTETAKRERKKALSQRHCKPGYEYNEIVGKCVLPYAAIAPNDQLNSLAETPSPAPSVEGPEMSTPNPTSSVDDAIRAEKIKRKSAGAQKIAQASKMISIE